MKIVDLFQRHEVLTKEVGDIFSLSEFVRSESEQKEKEDKIRKDNERALRLLKEIDELTNRIFKALATNEVEINGTQYSLATLHYYIASLETSSLFPMGECVGECNACKVPAFHPKYYNARLNYLQTLDSSKWLVADEGDNFLADPLKLHTKVKDYRFNFISEVRNVYLKAIATIEV